MDAEGMGMASPEADKSGYGLCMGQMVPACPNNFGIALVQLSLVLRHPTYSQPTAFPRGNPSSWSILGTHTEMGWNHPPSLNSDSPFTPPA